MMKLDKFTVKAQEALMDAQSIAQEHNQQRVEPTHLAIALVDQSEGIVKPLLQKLGVDISSYTGELWNEIERLPKVTGSGAGQVVMSQNLKKIFAEIMSQCPTLSRSLRDFRPEYLS